MANPNPKPTAQEYAERARHIFAQMIDGRRLREIAETEGLSVRRIQQIVVEEIGRRNVNPAEQYGLLQIARLERALDLLGAQIDAGKVVAVPAYVKVIQELSRLAYTRTLSRTLPRLP